MHLNHYLSLSVLAASLLARCGTSSVPTPEIQDRKPHSGPPDFHFDDAFPDTIEFEQGYSREFKLGSLAHVPSPGNAVLTVENLPVGAKFDGQTFAWTPACGAGALAFQQDLAESIIRFTLRSDVDANETIQRRVNLRVHRFYEGPGRTCGDPVWRQDSPGSSLTGPAVYFDQNFPATVSFFQGKSNTFDLRSNVHAVPVGAVTITVSGLPNNATFDGNQIVWTPSCTDNATLYVNGKRTVQIGVHIARSSDSTQFADRSLDLIAFKSTPCTAP